MIVKTERVAWWSSSSSDCGALAVIIMQAGKSDRDSWDVSKQPKP